MYAIKVVIQYGLDLPNSDHTNTYHTNSAVTDVTGTR